MYKIFVNSTLVLILAICTMVTPVAMGDANGACHFHGRKEASEEVLIRCSSYHRSRLAKKGALDSTWTALSHESIEKVTNPKGKSEWRIVFTNPTPLDANKNKLFMFFSLNGNFIAANHSGK